VSQQINEGFSDLGGAVGVNEEGIFPMPQKLCRRSIVRTDDGFPMRHRLQIDDPETFSLRSFRVKDGFAGHHEDITSSVVPCQSVIGNPTDKRH
jgi:hypothetical protein